MSIYRHDKRFFEIFFFCLGRGGGKALKSLEYFVILGELDFMLDTAQTSHSCDGFKNYWGGGSTTLSEFKLD